jgi:hypothetical protein
MPCVCRTFVEGFDDLGGTDHLSGVAGPPGPEQSLMCAPHCTGEFIHRDDRTRGNQIGNWRAKFSTPSSNSR